MKALQIIALCVGILSVSGWGVSQWQDVTRKNIGLSVGAQWHWVGPYSELARELAR